MEKKSTKKPAAKKIVVPDAVDALLASPEASTLETVTEVTETAEAVTEVVKTEDSSEEKPEVVETPASEDASEDDQSAEVTDSEPAPVAETTVVSAQSAQVIGVSGIEELLQPLLESTVVTKSDAVAAPNESEDDSSDVDKDKKTRELEYQNWFWNNRFAPAEEQEAAYKRIVG